MDRWHPGSHGTTFGGNPVACAASAATVNALRDVVPGVEALSQHSFARWNDLKAQHRTIGDVRGEGLMIGIDLVKPDGSPDPDAFPAIEAHALDAGMFILNCGPDGNIIRFIPPLNVSMDDLDRGIDILAEGLAKYEA
jgi:4-aminobutyrate aminotransferase